MKIINTYLLPILEYCSIVWYPKRIRLIKKLERPIWFATRTPLHSPYRSDDPLYLTYSQRLDLDELKLLTMEERRTINVLTTTCKILNDLLHTDLSHTLQRHVNQSVRSQHPNIFQYPTTLCSGPLKLMMATSNKFFHYGQSYQEFTEWNQTIARNFYPQNRRNSDHHEHRKERTNQFLKIFFTRTLQAAPFGS